MVDPIELQQFKERYDRVASRSTQPLSSGGGGGNSSDMGDRVGKIEAEVAFIKGSLDWAKIVAGVLASVMVGGFAIVITLILFTMNKVDGISGKIADEFRAQRSEQAAQITAISNAITAAKQQAPQVLLVPAPSPAPATAPSTTSDQHSH